MLTSFALHGFDFVLLMKFLQSPGEESTRLKSLSRFQAMMLKHALKFPLVKKVAYSTCSVHKEVSLQFQLID